MKHPTSPVVVRRREIDKDPPPVGGAFRERAVLPWRLPRLLTDTMGTYCVETTDPVVAVTYDDGPHPEHTPRILDALAARGARATFFVLGRQVEKYPEITRRIVAEGHQLGLHGHDHRSLLERGTREAMAAIDGARALVERIGGTRLTLYRPPYGSHTTAQARAVRKTGMDLVIWSGAAEDWVHDDEEEIARRAQHVTFPGSILLLHDDRGDPERAAPGEVLPAFDKAAVLELLLDGLESQGFRTVTVGELISTYPVVRSKSAEKGVRR